MNIIVSELICNITVPELALGYNKFNIGPANIHIPTVHGNPISIDINNVKVAFCFIALARECSREASAFSNRPLCG